MLWEAAGGTAYEAILNTQEMMHLQRLFQQRHLLAHREGIVDQECVRRSGDATYAPGQRLVIREQSVLQLADLLEKLVSGMRSDLQSYPSKFIQDVYLNYTSGSRFIESL